MGLDKNNIILFRAGAGVDSPNQYKWQPKEMNKKKFPKRQTLKRKPRCDAKAGSQGEDYDVTYVYKLSFVDIKEIHLAYVECDYVE